MIIFLSTLQSEQKFKDKMTDWMEEKTTLKKEIQNLSDRLAQFEAKVKGLLHNKLIPQ